MIVLIKLYLHFSFFPGLLPNVIITWTTLPLRTISNTHCPAVSSVFCPTYTTVYKPI